MKQPNTMLATITTKYCGPTGSKGSRISVTIHLKADGSKHRRTQSWLHEYGVHDNHQSAAKQALWGMPSPAPIHMDDIEVDGWTHDGVGHWVATVKAAPVHAPVIAGADDLRLVIEDLACYALVGWEDAMEDDRPEELAEWKVRVDAALKAVGSKYTYAELKPLLG